jgi:hypothetical protein
MDGYYQGARLARNIKNTGFLQVNFCSAINNNTDSDGLDDSLKLDTNFASVNKSALLKAHVSN